MKHLFFVLQFIFLVLEVFSSDYICSADPCLQNFRNDSLAGKVDEARMFCPDMKRGLLNGLQRIYWENGNIFSEEFFENGIRQGQARFFYESGAKKCHETYVHGLLEGKRYCWWENGTVQEVSLWRHGLLHSSLASQPAFLSYDSEGHPLERKNFVCGAAHGEELVFYPSGVLERNVLFVMGNKEGVEKEFNEKGEVIGVQQYVSGEPIGKGWKKNKEGSYQKLTNFVEPGVGSVEIFNKGRLLKKYSIFHGVLSGQYKEYYLTGELYRSFTFDQGVFIGEQLEYFPSGNLSMSLSYKEGKRDGIQESWYENGKREQQAAWKQGKLHGKFREWDEKGVLIFEADYDNGLRIEAL